MPLRLPYRRHLDAIPMDPALLSERLETACHTFETLER